VWSKVKSAFSTYLVIPSTLNFGACTLIEGFAQLIESISPFYYLFILKKYFFFFENRALSYTYT